MRTGRKRCSVEWVLNLENNKWPDQSCELQALYAEMDEQVTIEARIYKAKEYGCSTIYFIIDKGNSLKEELEGKEKDSASILKFRYIYGIDEIL